MLLLSFSFVGCKKSKNRGQRDVSQKKSQWNKICKTFCDVSLSGVVHDRFLSPRVEPRRERIVCIPETVTKKQINSIRRTSSTVQIANILFYGFHHWFIGILCGVFNRNTRSEDVNKSWYVMMARSHVKNIYHERCSFRFLCPRVHKFAIVKVSIWISL